MKQFGSRSGPTGNISFSLDLGSNCLQRFSADDKSPLERKEFRFEYGDMITPDRRQSKMLILSTNVDKNLL